MAELPPEDQEFYWETAGEVARDAFEDAVRDFVSEGPEFRGVVLRPEEFETDSESSEPESERG